MTSTFPLELCFNPCSGGLAVGTSTNNALCTWMLSFNPCSGGLAVGTAEAEDELPAIPVSILVLVD